MTRETKVNVVFLIAIVLVSLPGAILLFKKKLEPGEKPVFAPPMVRSTSAYNNPLESRSDVVRTAPPATLAWVTSLAQQRLGRPPLRHGAAGGRLDPQMSAGRFLELLDVTPEPDGGRVMVLAWLEEFGHERVTGVEGSIRLSGGESVPLRQVEVEPLAVPSEVVEELKDLGFVVPPTRVAILRLNYASAREPVRVELHWETATGSRTDVLELDRTLLARPGAGKD